MQPWEKCHSKFKTIMIGQGKFQTMRLTNLGWICRKIALKGHLVHETTNFKGSTINPWLINYFRDHLRDHFLIARPLNQFVVDAIKSGNNTFIWDSNTDEIFEELNTIMVHDCQKLHFIDNLSVFRSLLIMPTGSYVKSASLTGKRSKNLSVSWSSNTMVCHNVVYEQPRSEQPYNGSDINHYDPIVADKANIPEDVFSQLVSRSTLVPFHSSTS